MQSAMQVRSNIFIPMQTKQSPLHATLVKKQTGWGGFSKKILSEKKLLLMTTK